tara:strand:+ start:523 stop:1452 length:930 start_codon:yes stop_codon:yes gene_type:complete
MRKTKIWITGANGMVGRALVKKVEKNKKYEVLKTSRKNFDQTNQQKTENWIKKNKPDIIIITSALVGGIQLNSKISSEFLYQNSMIELNIIRAAQKSNCKKIVFLGASCMYPKDAAQPFKEESIFDGKVEETNEGYAVAKILGLKFLELINKEYGTSHLSIIPAASYGPNDCYDENRNHVIPALISKIYNAKIKKLENISLWGTGNAKREFIHVDDMADGILYIIEKYTDTKPINLGTGEEVSIKQLADIIKKIIGYDGKIIFDNKNPDGISRKILSNNKVKKLKWKKKISLKKGLEDSINEFIEMTKH